MKFPKFTAGIKGYETKGNVILIQNYQDLVLGNGEDCPPVIEPNGVIFKPKSGAFNFDYFTGSPEKCLFDSFRDCKCDTVDVIMGQTGKFFHYNFEKKERNKNLKNCIITRGNNYWNSNFLWKDELWHFPENDEEQYQRSFPVVYHYPPNVGEFLLEELIVSNQLTLNPGFNEFECQPHTIIKLTYTGPSDKERLFSSDEVGIFRDMDFSTHEDIKNSYLITINEATKIHIHVVMGIGTVAVAHLVFNAQSKQIPRIKEIFDYPYNLSDEIYNKLHFTSPYYALI